MGFSIHISVRNIIYIILSHTCLNTQDPFNVYSDINNTIAINVTDHMRIKLSVCSIVYSGGGIRTPC